MSLSIEEKKERIVDKAVELAEEHGIQFELSFDIKGGIAGQAHLNVRREYRVRLNSLLLHDNFDEMLNQTLPHEMAHIIAFDKHGDVGHGNIWKNVMRGMGLRPDRTHRYNMSKVRKHTLYCNCRTHHVSTRMYNLVAKGQHRKCMACHTAVRTTEKVLDN